MIGLVDFLYVIWFFKLQSDERAACSSPGLLLAVTADMLEVQTRTGEDGELKCTASLKPGVRYRSVRWYKVNTRVFVLLFVCLFIYCNIYITCKRRNEKGNKSMRGETRPVRLSLAES